MFNSKMYTTYKFVSIPTKQSILYNLFYLQGTNKIHILNVNGLLFLTS